MSTRIKHASRTARLIALSTLLLSGVALAGPKKPSKATKATSTAKPKAPAKAAASASRPRVASNGKPAAGAAAKPAAHGDPFLALRMKIPRNRLPPLQSVRIRDQRESRAGSIRVRIKTRPKGASVVFGRRLLGKTPLTLTAPRNSTPLDIVIRRRGYMTLRTRIHRVKSYTYRFRLHPAKLH